MKIIRKLILILPIVSFFFYLLLSSTVYVPIAPEESPLFVNDSEEEKQFFATTYTPSSIPAPLLFPAWHEPDTWLLHLRRGITVDMKDLARNTQCMSPLVPDIDTIDRVKKERLDRAALQKLDCEEGGRGWQQVKPFQPLSRYSSRQPFRAKKRLTLLKKLFLESSGAEWLTSKEVRRLFSIVSVAINDGVVEWNGEVAENWMNLGQVLEDLKQHGRIMKLEKNHSGSRTGWQLNTSSIQRCPFSVPPPDSRLDYDTGSFAQEGYSLSEFLFHELFAVHGFVPVPFTGTALGAVRHRGMYLHDDDMDFHYFAPASFLNFGAVGIKVDDGGNQSVESVFDYLDDVVEEYAFHNQDTNFHFFRPDVRDPSFRSYVTRPWMFNHTLRRSLVHLETFADEITQGNRPCSVMYASYNAKVRKATFGHPHVCRTNSWYPCLQPTEFLHYGSPASLFTANHRWPLGKLCRCTFGPGALLCPSNLPNLLQLWYGRRWCVPVGQVTDKKFAKLKSWND